MIKLFLKVLGLGWLGTVLLLVLSAVVVNRNDMEE